MDSNNDNNVCEPALPILTRRSLFPQNSLESDEDSDLGCISCLNSSGSDDDDDLLKKSPTNIDDYDIIGIVKKDLNFSPEATPEKDYPSLVIDESPINTPHSKSLNSSQAGTSNCIISITSPTGNLKTPHDSVSIHSKLPKLTHKLGTDSCPSALSKRKLSPYNSPELSNKIAKFDKNCKVRTALFPESDLVLPPKKFYSSSASIMEQLKERNKLFNQSLTDKVIEQKKWPTLCSTLNSRRRYTGKKKRDGKINAGVGHKIRKRKKNTRLPVNVKYTMNETQSNALKYYLHNLKNLKIYNKENAAPGSSTSIPLSTECSTNLCNQNLFADNQPDCNNLVNLSGPSSNVENSNIWFPNTAIPSKMSTETMQNVQTTLPTFLNEINTSKKQELMSQESRKRSLSPLNEQTAHTKKFFKSARDHKGIVTMNESIKLQVSHGKISLTRNEDSKSNLHQKDPLFVPENFTVEESFMSEVIMDNILSVLENENETEESHIQSNTSILQPSNSGKVDSTTLNPASLILSPISQMCDVTSGLALNSPKRVKNLSSVIESVSRNHTDLLSTRTITTSKKTPTLAERKFKKLHKGQMLLDAGQKKFGITQCSECDLVYHIGDPGDEAYHTNYHEAVPVLKFAVSILLLI